MLDLRIGTGGRELRATLKTLRGALGLRKAKIKVVQRSRGK
jgi:hypothetical protein